MGAILEKYEVHEAVIKAIDAGSDLILLRDESTLVDEVYAKVVEAVEEGKISEERLNDAAGRVLKIKAEYGLFEEGALVDPAEAETPARSSEVISIASEAAQRATRVLRDRKGILPLNPGTRVLLVEQANPLHINVNSQECHPGILWEAMMEHGSSVAMVEVKMSYEEADHQRIASRMEEADVVVLTNTYYRRGANGHEFVQEFCRNCEKPVVVVTNTDLPLSLDDSFDSVVLSFGSSPECVKEVARHLYGKAER